MAAAQGVPLLVDAAYGSPFPGIVFTDGGIDWSDNLILTWSLSKIGLPAVRTGIVVASEEVIHKLATVNAVISLATSGIGQTLVAPLFADGSITRLARETVRPFYQARRDHFITELGKAFAGSGVDWRLHECQGGFFVWLWFPRLLASATEVYRAARARGVFVTPGEAFFTGPAPELLAAWPHHRQCLRLNYADTVGDIPRGLAILAEEIAQRQG
jgi:valine--pyruvate aminotransferase